MPSPPRRAHQRSRSWNSFQTLYNKRNCFRISIFDDNKPAISLPAHSLAHIGPVDQRVTPSLFLKRVSNHIRYENKEGVTLWSTGPVTQTDDSLHFFYLHRLWISNSSINCVEKRMSEISQRRLRLLWDTTDEDKRNPSAVPLRE